ncbi:MAG TPA: two-component system sensor histidine kinase CreC [Candidatus Polarisedimenticolia bacterium]|nr:two-component system sensor histidine kinase CreC [Candidatus Polarisedimenticolia bacterium]
MRLGSALFLAYSAIFALCFSYPILRIASDLRTRYLESLEEPLVDEANLLATRVGHEMEAGSFSPHEWSKTLQEARGRELSAKIYEMRKERVDRHVYITDATGKIVFDSRDPDNVGVDYGNWRDVGLTLKGEYGARTTREDPDDPASAVLYVAAPIQVGGETVGVLTVAEPTTSINAFLRSAKPEIFRIAALSGAVAVLLSLLVSWWIARQIGSLTRYAEDVREGRSATLPRLAGMELKRMGDAFDRMREALEGKKYVEEYVQTLTHELKSPISAIRGAAELLQEGMPEADRARFLANIHGEAVRLEDLVERMLALSELETRRSLQSVERVRVAELVRGAQESKAALLARKHLTLRLELEPDLEIEGDPFLLHQALSNLLQNAIDFSPPGGTIVVRAVCQEATIRLEIQDQGPGIPEYAKGKLFQRFFSLQRPDTGKKSTGLGLNFAQEVAKLHRGSVRLENVVAGGLLAVLELPRAAQNITAKESR